MEPMAWLNGGVQQGGAGASPLSPNGAGGSQLPQNFFADITTKIDQNNRLLAQLIAAIQNLSPTMTGTFTMDAATSKVISNGAITSTSFVMLWPMNAAAGTLIGAGLYWTVTTGSFTVATSGGAATGGEVFNWASWRAL